MPTAVKPALSAAEEEELERAENEANRLPDDALVDVEEERKKSNSDSDEAQAAFRDYLSRRMTQPRFANGRSVRNALERARLRQATRLVNEKSRKLSKSDLMRIESEDIPKSRVFEDDGEGDSIDED